MLFPRKGGETMRILCADAGSEMLPVFFYSGGLFRTYHFQKISFLHMGTCQTGPFPLLFK